MSTLALLCRNGCLQVLGVWARILLAVPRSRLVLKNKPFACEAVRCQFWKVFEEAGVERSRVSVLLPCRLAWLHACPPHSTAGNAAACTPHALSLRVLPHAARRLTCCRWRPPTGTTWLSMPCWMSAWTPGPMQAPQQPQSRCTWVGCTAMQCCCSACACALLTTLV